MIETNMTTTILFWIKLFVAALILHTIYITIRDLIKRKKNPNLKGKVTVAFTIQPDGHVSAASVKESTVGSEKLENCIVSRVRTWPFPQPEAPVVTEVSAYPFYLNPSN